MSRLLYKYFPISSVEHIQRVARLFDGYVYFSSPSNFNDPFEMRPLLAPPRKEDFEEVLNHVNPETRALSKSAREKTYRRISDAIRGSSQSAVTSNWLESLGVLCLAQQRDDLLMWAHYGSNHTGVCVGFDSSLDIFRLARPVRYCNERPRVHAMDLSRRDDELIEQVLFTKSPHWAYEGEWRCVKRSIRSDELAYYKELIRKDPYRIDEVASILASEGGPGSYDFDLRVIRRVIFGARMDPSQRDQISELVGQIPWGIKVSKMDLDPRYFRLNEIKMRL